MVIVIIIIIVIVIILLLMVNAPQFSHKKIVEGLFVQLIVPSNQSAKGNIMWMSDKVRWYHHLVWKWPISMHQVKLSHQRIKVHSQNAYPWEIPRVTNTLRKIVVKDITSTMPWVAYTSSMTIVKGILRNHRQKVKLSKAFNLLPHCGYSPLSSVWYYTLIH